MFVPTGEASCWFVCVAKILEWQAMYLLAAIQVLEQDYVTVPGFGDITRPRRHTRTLI